jgi:D-3-phosphoglycerate dehydrogenase
MTQRRFDNPKIVLLDPGIASCTYEKELFEENGYHFDVFEGEKDDYETKLKMATDAVGILIRFTEINDAFLEQTPHLKAVARYGVGYDNIDLDACTRHGVRCSNVRGYGNHSVSDHALALMLGCMRLLKTGNENIYSQFSAPPSEDIPEIHQQVLGIIGLGRIGSTLAQKATPLFKKVIAYDPYISDEKFEQSGVEKVTFKKLIQSSNMISIHCNLTDKSRHLIDEKAFERMEQRPIIVNTARGEIIDEEALIRALKKDKIHSAGLDVFKTEIPQELSEELINHPNVMATGHYAWYSDRAQKELQKRTADNLLAMLQGKNPDDCLNPF